MSEPWTFFDLASDGGLKLLYRIIGSALIEGATAEVIDATLTAAKINEVPARRQRVEARQRLPTLRDFEVQKLGGRDAFRARFGLPPTQAPSETGDSALACTEQADAEFFARRNASGVRFHHRRGEWLISDNATGIWLPDSDGAISRLAVQSMRAKEAAASSIHDHRERQRVIDWAIKGQNRSRLMNMLHLAQAVTPLADAGDGWDQNPYLLGCANGVVDLRTGTLRRAEPSEKVSFSTRVHFDPDAQSELWDQTLRQIFPQPGLTDFVQRAFGYSTLGVVELDKWLLGHGEGRNGKGTTYGSVAAAMGDYSLELPAEALKLRGKSYDLANLPGRRFVTCSESGDTFQLDHDLLKRLTGGDRIRAANKYQLSFEFDPQCHLWLACNKKPEITDDSVGFWSRVVVIPFTQTFLGPDADPSVRTHLRDVKGPHVRAVLAWLVRGAVLVAREGLGAYPAAVQEATDAYRNESGPLAAFIDEECVERPDAEAKAASLLNRFNEWSSARSRPNMSARSFGMALRKRFAVKDKNDGAWYQGLALMEKRREF